MTERSGIEMIEDLLNKVTELDRRYVVIEQLLKELLNRANGFGPPTKIEAPKLVATEPTQSRPSIKTSQEPGQQEVSIGQNTEETYKAMGKIKDKQDRMRSGVNVTIYDDNNKIIKKTKTNRAGEWMAFLPTGRYSAEYYLKDEIHANVTFTVQAGTITRVSQPEI